MLPKIDSDILLTMLHRLEAATSRLEDMVPNIGDPSDSVNGIQSGKGQGMTAAEEMGQARSAAPPTPKHVETLPPTIDDFDGIINGAVSTFVNISEEIGGLVAEQVRDWDQASLKALLRSIDTDVWPVSLPLYFEHLLQNGSF